MKGTQVLTGDWLLSGTSYLRRFESCNVSSNVNGETDEDGPRHQRSLVHRTNSLRVGVATDEHGATIQPLEPNGIGVGVGVGVGIDRGSARFTRDSQGATFMSEHGMVPLSEFVANANADTRTRCLGGFASNLLELSPQWTLRLAERLNQARLSIEDGSGSAPELDISHTFTRFNPVIGLNYTLFKTLTLYGGCNEGMRAPTAIQLACGDPNASCKLPSNFLADPPLKAVVSKPFELGARGKLDARTSRKVALFRNDLHDDLQFISSTGVAISSGYFQNVGTTRRQGLELSGNTRAGPFTAALHHSFIDAKYVDGCVANSLADSSVEDSGVIRVGSGNRVPSIPRHSLEVCLEANPTADWHIGANVLIASGVFARGGEDNQDVNGRVPGCAVLKLDARYRLNRQIEFFARFNHVRDRRYFNFGVLGQNFATATARGFEGANPRAEQFRGYGAPHGAWVGVRHQFDQMPSFGRQGISGAMQAASARPSVHATRGIRSHAR